MGEKMDDKRMISNYEEPLDVPGQDRSPLVLGVTGGIGSGKSTIVECFGRLGAAVLSADQLAREAVMPGSSALEKIRKFFGDEFLQSDGTLDREKMASRVFSDAESRVQLEKIVRPAIAALAETRLTELRRGNDVLVVYEAPLLYEAAAEGRVDRVLTVWVRPEVQLNRLCQRNGLTKGEALQRIRAQFPQEVKVVRANEVIDNSGSLGQTRCMVELLFKRLVAAG